MKPVKYILLITLVLFVFVFLVTLPGRLRANKNEDNSSGTNTSSTSSSDTAASAETSVQNGTSAIVVGGEPESTSTSSATTTTAAGEKTMENDNAWAFFLVNQANPLPDNFTVTTKQVQGKFEMDERCADYMVNMIADAKAAGINLNILSAYRSVEYQQTLFDKDVAAYVKQGYSQDEAATKTAQAVAIPGQSEHNAGICADICDLTESFEDTSTFKWLSENADKYGFILRYPKGKESITGIEYEPWHYRFVGPDKAAKIKASGLCLEEYFQQQQ